MCGIVGAFNPAGEVCSADVLERMRDAITPRGPDGAGLWRSLDGRAGLAHRRLSIIDLSEAASQPMFDPEGKVGIVFNGEIYNHAQIRRDLEKLGKYKWRTDHSDTEALLYAYMEWGADCVHRLYGMFAFAVYDARDPVRPRLTLVRDRVGVKPLYISRTDKGEWLFASEIKALLKHPDISPQMDLTAFWHYLTFIVAPAPLTMFRGVFKIPAGSIVEIDHEGRARARRYWDCVPGSERTLSEKEISEEEAVAELTRLMKRSIERRMVSDVPFGVLLSGGIDSSMNVALMSELMDRPVTTFSIGYEGKEDYNEFQYARRISERYGTEHHETLINRKAMQNFLPELVRLQDEPIADNVCIPLYFLAGLVRKSGTTVVQVGEGADENFLGYWWCEHYRDRYENVYKPERDSGGGSLWRRLLGLGKARAATAMRGHTTEEEEIRRRARAGQELFWGGAVCWFGDMRSRLTPNADAFRQKLECPVEGLLPEGHERTDSHEVVSHYLSGLTGRLAEPEVLQKITYMEHKLRLPEHLLMRVDKMTMAHSVEARVPFLDHDVVEFALKLPLSYKLRDGVGKRILKKAAEPYLDHDIIYRKKQGFGAPMEEWFKEKEFGEKLLATFERSPIVRDGLLDRDYFVDLLKFQMGSGGGYSFHLWTVMNAILWHALWVEGNSEVL